METRLDSGLSGSGPPLHLRVPLVAGLGSSRKEGDGASDDTGVASPNRSACSSKSIPCTPSGVAAGTGVMEISGAALTVGATAGVGTTDRLGSPAGSDGDLAAATVLGLGRGLGRGRTGIAGEGSAVGATTGVGSTAEVGSTASESGTAGAVTGAEAAPALLAFGIEPVESGAPSASIILIVSIKFGQLLLG